jgi:iron complex outermembrane recepter protein
MQIFGISKFARVGWVASGMVALVGVGPSFAQDVATGETEILEEMVVTGSADASSTGLIESYAGGQVARGGRVGLLGPQDYMESPFSSTNYTSELIKNQQAASVGDVLINDPAVRVARGFGNFQQLYKIRGLPTYSDDMTFNGLYGLLPRQYLGTELIERVEVFRGANAFLNGAAPGGSALGGTVNILPKRAKTEPFTELTTGIQTGGQLYGAFDFSRRLSDQRLGVRVNGALRDGDTAVDGESTNLGLIGVGVDWQQEDLRISFDAGYQNVEWDATQPSVTLAAGVRVPDAPDASKSIAQPWTYSDEEDFFSVLRAEYDLAENLTVWGAVGGRLSEERNSFANPTVVDNAGTTSSYRFDNAREDEVRTGEIGIRGKFETGPLLHEPSLSFNAYELKSDNSYAFSSFAGFAGSLEDPFEVERPAATALVGGDLNDPDLTQKTEMLSLALADKITLFNERLILLGGVRYQEIEETSYDYNSGAEISNYSDEAVTPVAGVLFKFTPKVAGYFNYIEGLTRGEVAPTTSGSDSVANAGEALAPYETQQIEVGMKADFGKIGGSLGVFRSEKPVSGVDDDLVFKELYDQVYRGVELSVFGEPAQGFRLLGGLSLLDTEREGKDQIGSPTVQVNLGAEWDVPFVPGLTLDARGIHTGSQYADTANTQKLPDWTRFDAGARYVKTLTNGQVVTFRARVENLADENYWASAGGYPGAGYLTVGAPRTLVVSASWSF